MKHPSQQFLRLSTIAFFAIMIAGPVLYRCGTFKKQQLSSGGPVNWFTEAQGKPWFDSVAFQQITSPVKSGRMHSSKSGPPFGSHPLDSLRVLELMEMRYGTPRFSAADVHDFQLAYQRISGDNTFKYGFWMGSGAQDSIHAFFYTQAGGADFSGLNPGDLKIVNVDLKNHRDAKLQQGMTPYLKFSDTLNALKSLRIQKIRQ